MGTGLGTNIYRLASALFRTIVFKLSPFWSHHFPDLFGLVQLGKVSAGLVHDLASPLAVLQLSLENLPLPHHPQLQRSRAALQIMQTYLDFARQQLATDLQTTSLRPYYLLNQAQYLLQPLLRKQHILLQIHCTPRLTIVSSPALITKIVLNILTNAIEAFAHQSQPHPTPQITVTARSTRQYWEITICDNAGGIPTASLRRLFLAYPHSTKAQHLGLGLTLCREWAHQLQGTLEVTTRPGQGSTFTLQIPHLRVSASSPRMKT